MMQMKNRKRLESIPSQDNSVVDCWAKFYQTYFMIRDLGVKFRLVDSIR